VLEFLVSPIQTLLHYDSEHIEGMSSDVTETILKCQQLGRPLQRRKDSVLYNL